MKKNVLFLSVSLLTLSVNGGGFKAVEENLKAMADTAAINVAYSNDFNPVSTEMRMNAAKATGLSEQTIDALFFSMEAAFQYLLNNDGFMPGLSQQQEQDVKAAFTRATQLKNNQAIVDATMQAFVTLYNNIKPKTRPEVQKMVAKRTTAAKVAKKR